MSTGIFIGEIVKRGLYLVGLALSFYTINVNLILFFLLAFIFVLLILLSVYTIVIYDQGLLQVIQNRFLGLNKKIIVFNLLEIESIQYHNFGLDLSNRMFNFLSPAGARVPIKQDFLKVKYKSGKELKVEVNLEGGRLEKIMQRVNSDLR